MKTVASMIVLTGFAGLVVACGSSFQPPNDRLASSEAAIRSARELGADGDPRAAYHLTLANEQVATARNLIKDGDNRRADLVLQRAKSDAELAVVLTRAKGAKSDAQNSQKTLDAQESGK